MVVVRGSMLFRSEMCKVLVAGTDQRPANSRKKMTAAMVASSNAAAMRQSKVVGAEGIGPSGRFGARGGSSTPMPVNLRGGPPPRAGEACGSNSDSYSAKSCGMKLNVTPVPAKRLEQPEHRFDGHPS